MSMARRDLSAQPDGQVQQILDLLTAYERLHPQAQIEGRRHNPASIRLRTIDPDFQGMDRIARESAIWKLLHQLPEEVFVNITMLLLLTPEETAHSLASQEFDHPILRVCDRAAKHLRAWSADPCRRGDRTVVLLYRRVTLRPTPSQLTSPMPLHPCTSLRRGGVL